MDEHFRLDDQLRTTERAFIAAIGVCIDEIKRITAQRDALTAENEALRKQLGISKNETT